MITATGYSKDKSIMPEGIAVTFGKEMMDEQGGPLSFLRYFEECMDEENNFWNHKCKNKPQFDVDHVYIICMNRLYSRVYFGGYKTQPAIGYTADGGAKEFNWPRIILAGPIEKPTFKRKLQGFQGFRYTTKLFL